MPSASDRLREKFWKSNGDGIAEAEAVLKERFTVGEEGMIRPTHEPEPKLTRDEADAIDFLCDEWDYAYTPWPKEPK